MPPRFTTLLFNGTKSAVADEDDQDDQEYSGSTLSEDAMYANERYREAVHEEIGLLQVRTALSLLQRNKPEIAKKFAEASITFVEELQQTSDEEEKKILAKLLSELELLVKGEFARVNIEQGLKIVDQLGGQTKKTTNVARDEYYRFFKRY